MSVKISAGTSNIVRLSEAYYRRASIAVLLRQRVKCLFVQQAVPHRHQKMGASFLYSIPCPKCDTADISETHTSPGLCTVRHVNMEVERGLLHGLLYELAWFFGELTISANLLRCPSLATPPRKPQMANGAEGGREIDLNLRQGVCSRLSAGPS